MLTKKYFYENKKANLYFEALDKEDVVNFILEKACITLDFTNKVKEMDLQNEILEVIAESFVDEIEEEEDEEEDVWENDLIERQREYREMQGF